MEFIKSKARTIVELKKIEMIFSETKKWTSNLGFKLQLVSNLKNAKTFFS
jgi:hypothetical protein